MDEILEICKRAKLASTKLLKLNSAVKNDILKAVAEEILNQKEAIKEANAKDIAKGRENGLSNALLDRLLLTDARIEAMAKGVVEVANFSDVIGEIIGGWRHQNGMSIAKIRVPLGVLGVIYESRPNVTIDAAALALKSSNAIILRGSSSAINSNKFLVELFNQAGAKFGLPQGSVQLVTNTSREAVLQMAKIDEFIDVLIPRGGRELKKFIKQNATIAVLETGAGMCHIFVDESADVALSLDVIKNAKTQRPSACNAVECVLLHEKIADKILPSLIAELESVNLKLHSDLYANFRGFSNVCLAKDEDFATENLDMIMAIKKVSEVGEAIEHINRHSTKHSEAILTQNLANAERFLNEVDSACVYLNASTRFSDGGEFGFGGEIGISTQKLHARGPMGVRELTTGKYIIRGEGQIR